MSDLRSGGVNPIDPGPFRYELQHVPGEGLNRKFGGVDHIMQVSEHTGNRYLFAVMDATGMPGDPEFTVRALNREAKRIRR